MQDADENDQGASLRGGREEGDGGSRHALVDVWSPPMEGNEGDLERERRDDREEPGFEKHVEGVAGVARGETLQPREARRPEAAVYRGDAVEEERGRERAREEVLQGRLRRGRHVAVPRRGPTREVREREGEKRDVGEEGPERPREGVQEEDQRGEGGEDELRRDTGEVRAGDVKEARHRAASGRGGGNT